MHLHLDDLKCYGAVISVLRPPWLLRVAEGVSFRVGITEISCGPNHSGENATFSTRGLNAITSALSQSFNGGVELLWRPQRTPRCWISTWDFSVGCPERETRPASTPKICQDVMLTSLECQENIFDVTCFVSPGGAAAPDTVGHKLTYPYRSFGLKRYRENSFISNRINLSPFSSSFALPSRNLEALRVTGY